MKLSDPQIKRQQIKYFAAPDAIQQLRVAKNVAYVFGQRGQHRLPLLGLSFCIVVSAAGVHELLKEAGRLGTDDSLDTAIRGNMGELFRDLDCPIKSSILINQPSVFSLAAGPDAPLTN